MDLGWNPVYSLDDALLKLLNSMNCNKGEKINYDT